MDYFIAMLNNEEKIAIPLSEIKEVISINSNDICLIPGVKDSLLGIINQRGNLLWLLDLSKLLLKVQFLPKKYFHSLTILVTKIEDNYLGLVVSKLGEIKECLHLKEKVFSDNGDIFTNYYEKVIVTEEKDIPVIDLINIKNYLQLSQSS